MIRTLKIATGTTLAALIMATTTQTASADRRDRISQLVAPTITSVISDANGLRIVAGDDGSPFLAVEKIENGRITQQTFVREVTFADGGSVKVEDIDAIVPTRFISGSIEFTVQLEGARSVSRCSAVIDGRRIKQGLRSVCEGNSGSAPPPPVVGCVTKRSNAVGGSDWSRGLSTDIDRQLLGGKISKYRILWLADQWTSWFEPGKNDVDGARNPDGSQRRVWAYFTDHAFEYEICGASSPNPTYPPIAPPPPPPPTAYTPTVQDIQNATAVCSDAFTFKSEIDPCVNATVSMLSTRFGSSAFKMVTACKNAFTFGSERVACLQVGASSKREPVELIEFCAKNNTFGSEKTACLRKWSAN
jgi:hypothetical protein